MAIVQVQARSTRVPSFLRNHVARSSLARLQQRVKGVSLADNKVASMLNKMGNLSAIEGQGAKTMMPINGGGDERALVVVEKMHLIADAAANRAEMHKIIGQQRDNWNTLLLNSINTLNLTASLMAGASQITSSSNLHAFKISSVLLFAAGAGMMALMNRLQPSQLAEEQRNATRLFNQLERSIRTSLALRSPKSSDVDAAMERVLALDKAYPLPLLPQMLERFPETLEPTRWWPRLKNSSPTAPSQPSNPLKKNGWSKEKEQAMRGILNLLKRKDEEQYVRIGKMVRDMNWAMAVSGPVLAAIAAVGSSFIGTSTLPVTIGIVAGVIATIVNTVEHGGQVGMVFELFRNLAGYYRLLQEEIENNLEEEDERKREDVELFELKMALQLGRPASDFPSFAKHASRLPSYQDKDEIPEFASKLF